MDNNRATPLRFPQDFPKFLLWVFFRPSAIYRYLYMVDTSLYGNDDPNLLILWRRRKKHPEFISIISLTVLSAFFLTVLIFPILYFNVDWTNVQILIFAGIILGLTFGLSAELGFFITLDFVIVFGGSTWLGLVLGIIGGIIIFTYQGLLARQVQFERVANNISNAKDLDSLISVPDNINSWLPENMRGVLAELLTSLDLSSQHARAVLETDRYSDKMQTLRNGISEVDKIMKNPSIVRNPAMASTVIPALEKLKLLFEHELSNIKIFEEIPNIYHSGNPLVKNSQTFKGRDDIFHSLNREFDNLSGQHPALLLFGARRVGKSSTLNQLSAKLVEQIIPIIIDMQAETAVENVSILLTRISEKIVSGAKNERSILLPVLDGQVESNPYSVFLHWLDKVEEELKSNTSILIALDEFEALGNMFSEGRIDERFFQTLRSLIQHRQRITILLCGAHTLEELPPWWSKYFINVKMSKVGRLKETEAKELITRPIRSWPVIYDPIAVERILFETGCHPNWLQHTCEDIVDKLNQEKRLYATIDDAAQALASVSEAHAGDFIDLWEGDDSNDLMRSVLKFVATSKNGKVGEDELQSNFSKQQADLRTTLIFLTRRDILIHNADQYYFNANLLRKWVVRR